MLGGLLLFALTPNSTQFTVQIILYFQHFYPFFFLQFTHLQRTGVNVVRNSGRPAGFSGHGIYLGLTLWPCLNYVSAAVGD